MNSTNNPNKQQILNDAYNTLRIAGIIKTWKDFAELLDINKTCLSAAKNGQEQYLTDSLISKVTTLMDFYKESKGIQISHSNIATDHSQITVESKDKEKESNVQLEMVPVIPQNLYKETDVNILEYVTDEDSDVQMSPAVHQFPSTTCYYQVVTSAMYPHFHQGDILALKKLDRTAPIVNGEVYAIDTVNLGILVRFAYDRGDRIEMRSTPESEKRFETFFIDKKDIFTIFRVVGLLRTNI